MGSWKLEEKQSMLRGIFEDRMVGRAGWKMGDQSCPSNISVYITGIGRYLLTSNRGGKILNAFGSPCSSLRGGGLEEVEQERDDVERGW